MPRRGTEILHSPEPPKKKTRVVVEPPPSLDVSFCDDEALPPGIVFNDVQQKKWRIGKPIGRGSFGRIYLSSDEVDKEVTKANAKYVVKIEPHTNGPLFVEIHCLIRTAQASKVKSWRQQNKLKRLGMPVYIASGSFTEENTGIKYRFLVLPRYDIDLQKIISRTRVLDLKNVLILALQILDVLEYLHSQGYTHSDIKSSNLMLGFDGGKWNKQPQIKPTPSFQKETKEVAVLSGKYRRPKIGKGRASNYYDDEDYILKEHRKSDEISDNDPRLAKVKRKLRKILSDRDSRTLHRHHAFNLRQLSNYVNYEDLNSSVCSDQSYQRHLDDFGNNFLLNSEEFYEDNKIKYKNEPNDNSKEIQWEAVHLQSNGQIYLLDYGLASKFLDSEGNHKDFGMDARKAHDGTLEYSSRDSHIGAHSRRSDLETLGYNLLDWLTGTLPWKTTEVLAEPDLVHAIKKNFMSDIKLLLKTCFKTEFYPQFLEKYLQYVTSLDFTENPDYDYCRSLFKSELLRNGYDKDMTLNFAEASMSPINKMCYSKRFGRKNTSLDFLTRNGLKKAYERENVHSLENDLKLELLKQTLNSSSDGVRKPCASRNFFISDADLVARLKKSLMPHDVFSKKLSPKNLRSAKKVQKKRGKRTHRNSIGKFGNFMGSARQFTWAEILAGNPEDIIRKERNTAYSSNDEEDDDNTCKYRIRKLSNSSDCSTDSNLLSPLLQKDYLQDINPTYAMKEVIANLKNKISGKPKESEDCTRNIEGYTPAMMKVLKIKEKNEAKERLEAAKQAKIKERNEAKERTEAAKQTKIKERKEAKERMEVAKQTKIKERNEAKEKMATAKQTKVKQKNEAKEKIETAKQTKVKEKNETKEKIESFKQTNSKQELQPEQHCTRSMRSKNNMNTTKTNASKQKNVEKTKQKKSVTETVDIINTDTRTKAKASKNSKTKVEVKIVDIPKTPAEKKNQKTSTRKKQVPVPGNRRCLRSSKRLK